MSVWLTRLSQNDNVLKSKSEVKLAPNRTRFDAGRGARVCGELSMS